MRLAAARGPCWLLLFTGKACGHGRVWIFHRQMKINLVFREQLDHKRQDGEMSFDYLAAFQRSNKEDLACV